MPLQGNPADWRAGSRIAEIYSAIRPFDTGHHTKGKCAVCDPTYRSMRNRLGSKPFIYRSGGVELPVGVERGRRLRNEVFEVHEHMVGRSWESEAPSEAPEAPAEPIPAPEPTPAPSEVPVTSELPEDVVSAAQRFYAEVQRLRDFTESRDRFDVLTSMRVVIDGVNAIKAGVPVDGLLASIGATWQADTRAQAQIPAFDYARFEGRPSEFSHAVSAYVARLVKANVPVWMHGPAGTGKSSAAKHAAAQSVFTTGPKAGQPLDYYEVNLAGAMASAIKGKDRLKEFVESEFARAYEHGGLICLEEFDAAHPTVATAINNAIAGDHFANDADGRTIARHPDFRIVATANTLGTGATKEFNGRMKLDGATLDRFRMGRVFVGLDRELESSIFNSILNG